MFCLRYDHQTEENPHVDFLSEQESDARQAASLSQIKARCRTVVFSINTVQSAFEDCHARQTAYSFTNARCRNLAVLGQGWCMLLVLFDRLPSLLEAVSFVFLLLDQIKPIGRLVPVN